jgi:hypothetical protein
VEAIVVFSRRRVVAFVLTAVAAVSIGYRLDGAQAASPAAQSTPTKSVGGYWMLSADGHVFAFGIAA